jgi:hypothetical protein
MALDCPLSGAIVVDPVTGACVGIIDAAYVMRRVKKETGVERSNPGWYDAWASFHEGHSVADVMQPMTQPRSHEFGEIKKTKGVRGAYRECSACGCGQKETKFGFEFVSPIGGWDPRESGNGDRVEHSL